MSRGFSSNICLFYKKYFIYINKKERIDVRNSKLLKVKREQRKDSGREKVL